MRKHNGFTFIELMLALLLAAIATAAMFVSLSAALRARDNIENTVEPLQQGNIAISFLRKDLESALPPTGLISLLFQATEAKGDGGNEADDLIFAAAVDGPRSAIQTDVRQVEYTVVQSGTDHVLVRRTTSNALAISQSLAATADEEVICRGVRSLTFRYYDGTNWYTTWDSTQQASSIGPQQSNALPQAVEVTLEIDPVAPARPGVKLPTVTLTRMVTLPCASATTQSSTTGSTP